jgi:hypothetical protein
MTIENPQKIGLGLWDFDSRGSALNHVDAAGFAWHYNWRERPLWDVDALPEQSEFVGMIWDETHVTDAALARLAASGATTLLGFNEPDIRGQADMSVAQALDLWGRLESTGLRLGSPACGPNGTLGADSWLGRFMAGVEERGLRVDFVAVHFYSETGSVEEFRTFLEAAHKAYGRPVWVTEWCLADWDQPDRFSAAQQAAFARAATEMMDDLDFVERHAWFAGYEGGDGWHLGSGVFNADGQLTAVGQAFADLLDDSPEIIGTDGDDVLVGGARGDFMSGLGGADNLAGEAGHDEICGGRGTDRLAGGDGADVLRGGSWGDSLLGGEGADLIAGGGGDDFLRGGLQADRFVFRANCGVDFIEDWQDNRDTLVFDDSLWGGGARKMSQVLGMGRIVNGDAVFSFGDGQRVVIDNVSKLSTLRDDIDLV